MRIRLTSTPQSIGPGVRRLAVVDAFRDMARGEVNYLQPAQLAFYNVSSPAPRQSVWPPQRLSLDRIANLAPLGMLILLACLWDITVSLQLARVTRTGFVKGPEYLKGKLLIDDLLDYNEAQHSSLQKAAREHDESAEALAAGDAVHAEQIRQQYISSMSLFDEALHDYHTAEGTLAPEDDGALTYPELQLEDWEAHVQHIV